MSLRSLVSQREGVLANTRLVWTRILGSQETPFPTQALAITRPTAIKTLTTQTITNPTPQGHLRPPAAHELRPDSPACSEGAPRGTCGKRGPRLSSCPP